VSHGPFASDHPAALSCGVEMHTDHTHTHCPHSASLHLSLCSSHPSLLFICISSLPSSLLVPFFPHYSSAPFSPIKFKGALLAWETGLHYCLFNLLWQTEVRRHNNINKLLELNSKYCMEKPFYFCISHSSAPPCTLCGVVVCN
jgi:hypothetical protein